MNYPSKAAEAWTAVIRWDLGFDRMRVRVPCGCRKRAAWLRRRTGGHLRRGAVAAGGAQIAPLLRALDQPADLVALAERYGAVEGNSEAAVLARNGVIREVCGLLGLEPPAAAVSRACGGS